jgi:DNA topoisomerase-2
MPAAMETEVPKVPPKKKEPSKVPAKKKEPSKTTAAQKKPFAAVTEVSDVDENDSDDEVFELETGKKGGKKPAANAKAAKAPAAAKKRGAPKKQQPQTSGQKLLTDMFKPAENAGISPEKKVRKMRASPFNKKSSSMLGRVSGENEATGGEENLGSASTSASTEESVEAVPARARPQRANRNQTRYVLSDSESENPPDDSDFDEEEGLD